MLSQIENEMELETFKKIVSALVDVSTINCLGDSHTRPGGDKPHWLNSRVRTNKLVKVIKARSLDIICLQEFQSVQKSHFLKKSYIKKHYGLHNEADNAVAWDRRIWKKVDSGFYSIPYFGGQTKKMPWVVLQHLKTGVRIVVSSAHSPANTRGDASEWRRQGWKNIGEWAQYAADLRHIDAVFVGLDANAYAKYFRPAISKVGGTISGIDEFWGIDYNVMWTGKVEGLDDPSDEPEWHFHESYRTDRISKMTDHPVVRGKVKIYI